MLNNEITTHVKINLGNSIVIGPGKIELLKEINKKGSISAAARSLKMSYKKSWHLIDIMNSSFVKPVVIASTGGTNGGGALVTEFGNEIIKKYTNMHKKALKVVNNDARSFLKFLSN